MLKTHSFYIQTLTATDIFTGWTETEAVKNKARIWVFQGLKNHRSRFPFPILGIDSDNGGEFINHHLYEYCISANITFTRSSRSYRKNDNCYVEQKNYSVVRKMVGYRRYDTEEEQKILNRLYNQINPAQLKREMEKLQNKLIDLSVTKKRLRREQKEVQKQEDFVYNLSEAAESILRIDSYVRH